MSDLAFDLASSLGGEPLTKSLAEILAIVRFRGDFRNTVRFPAANIETEIQAAWAELYELIADTNEGYWDTTAPLLTVAAQEYVALPSDAWRVRKLSRLDGSDYIPMDQIGIDRIDRFGTSNGRPVAFRLTARGADLYQVPDAVYTLRIVYTPVAPVLFEARQWYNGWEEYVIYGALIRLTLNEERSSGDWQAQLDMARARIVRGASQRKAQEPEYIPLRDSSWSDFDRDERWR